MWSSSSLVLSTIWLVAAVSAVSVDKGETATMTWDIPVSNFISVELYLGDTLLASLAKVETDPTYYQEAKDKFGGRIKLELVDNNRKVQVTITNVEHGDEGDYKAELRVTSRDFQTLGTRTLDVKGLSSSDTGMIVGIVIGVILLIIIICVCVYCYKRKKSNQDEESNVPMNEQTSSSPKVSPEENHYAQYQATTNTDTSNKTNTPIVYSELGPGGRTGPKDHIPEKSHYAFAKE